MLKTSVPTATIADFLVGGGEMGALMRAHDWSANPLGGPASWPQSLRTAVRLLLNTNHPMFIWWGPQLIQFYNDAYRQTMGPERHPSALGQRGRECWAEIWHIIGPQIDQVMSGGGATWHENQLVPVTRHGALQQVYWTYGFSPIDEDDGIGGVLVVCRDVTEDFMAAKALREREAELARVQQVGRIGGLEVDLRTGFRNRRSPEYLAIHGLLPDATHELHEDWVRRIHPDDREITEKKFRDAIASNVRDYAVQYRIVRPIDGEVRWISVRSTIERDADGRAVRLVGAHSDITEQVLAEQALRQSEERYRTLADQLAELNATLAQRVEEKTRERDRIWNVSQDLLLVFQMPLRSATSNRSCDTSRSGRVRGSFPRRAGPASHSARRADRQGYGSAPRFAAAPAPPAPARYIAVSADQPHGLPIGVALDRGANRNPAHLAVNRTNDPVLHRVVAHVACDRIAEFLLGYLAIVGMDTPHPVLMRLMGRVGQQAVNGEIFR